MGKYIDIGMGRDMEIKNYMKLFKEIRKEQNDNVIIGYIDDEQLAGKLVDMETGTKDRFKIVDEPHMEGRGYDVWIEPIDYKK